MVLKNRSAYYDIVKFISIQGAVLVNDSSPRRFVAIRLSHTYSQDFLDHGNTRSMSSDD